MNIEIRTITEPELPDFWDAITRGFGDDPPDDEVALERFRAMMSLEGTIGAFDNDDIVGTLGTYFFDLTVPGGQVPMAGTTVVSVRPTHRRRGVLTAMMRKHLSDMRERSYPVAALRASEYGIYRRFGYGHATDSVHFKIDRRLVTFPDRPDDVTIRLVDATQAAELFPPIYQAVRETVPGMFSRSPIWWEHRVLADPATRRSGSSKLRHVIAERDGVPVGYASYRQKSRWEDWKPESELTVTDHHALDLGARRALWSYLANIDLFPHISVAAAPVDHPMLWEVDQPRYVQRIVNDALWLRILDLPAALESRTYRGEGRVVIAVDDPLFEEVSGSYLLEVSDGKGQVSRTDAGADLTLGIAELGALYLGGRSLDTLVKAGLASGTPDAIDLVDAMFHSSVTPFSPEVF